MVPLSTHQPKNKRSPAEDTPVFTPREPDPRTSYAVIKFGKYDDTTLFPTDTPSVIKDPGEFAALRANV